MASTNKKFTCKALMVTFKKTLSIFSRIFPGLENCWAISRLIQTLHIGSTQIFYSEPSVSLTTKNNHFSHTNQLYVMYLWLLTKHVVQSSCSTSDRSSVLLFPVLGSSTRSKEYGGLQRVNMLKINNLIIT